MGFLKRLFSVGSKKSKKSRPPISNPTPLPSARTQVTQLQPVDEDQEAAVSRLLRSSSSRYAVVSEVDYASLPPLREFPINDVIQTPAASTASIASTSLSQRGTYTVTIHRRKHHAATEFPDANRGLDDTPSPGASAEFGSTPRENDAHLLGLRRDPSVASLIDLYDEHGRLPDEAFSNSPPEGRPQTKRTGSTLRQLLGNPPPSSRNRNTEYSTLEGDISWAERFLGETDSISSTSSFGLRTPNDPDAHFINEPSIQSHVHHEPSFSTDHDLSTNPLENPGISSMEVELSSAAENSFCDDRSQTMANRGPYQVPDPATPQRASQIFGFLTSKRQSRLLDDANGRPLPELPSAFSSPSDEDANPYITRSHFSDNTSFESESVAPSIDAHIPQITDTQAFNVRSSVLQPSYIPRTPSRNSFTSRSSLQNQEQVQYNQPGVDNGLQTDCHDIATPLHKVKVIMNGPTKVIVTAPTPCENAVDAPPSRIPGGPRAPGGRRRSSHTRPPPRPMLVERSNTNTSSNYTSTSSFDDNYTTVPSRHKRTQSRSSSQISVVDVSFEKDSGAQSTARPAEKRPARPARYDSSTDLLAQAIATQLEKENALATGNALNAVAPIPFTPMRSNSSGRSSLFRTAVTPSLFRPPVGNIPSPASSSELSPVAKEMMTNLRQQRMKAREADREKGRKRHGSGRMRL